RPGGVHEHAGSVVVRTVGQPRSLPCQTASDADPLPKMACRPIVRRRFTTPVQACRRARLRSGRGSLRTHRGPLIGVVARPQPEKGVRYFVEAAARVAAAVPDARFVVIGDGPLRASLGALVDRLGLANRLLFTGFCL